MFNYFPGFGAKGRDTKGLIKNSITLLGNDVDVFKPSIYMTVIKSLRTIAIFFATYYFIISKDLKKGFISIIVIILLAPLISYLNMKYKAITCWMIYDVLRGKDTDVSIGSSELRGVGLTIFLYSIVDYIVKAATAKNNDKEGGLINFVKGIILAIFKEVWDLIKNFSLPAIVIDRVSIREIPTKLKMIKHNIPQSLVGILGIDVVGSVFVSLFGFIQLPSILIGFGVGNFAKGIFPSSYLFTLPLKEPLTFNVLPLFIILFFTTTFVTFLNCLVQLVKTTYFTTFYVSITRPEEISPEIREEVTEYLNFNSRLDGYQFFKEEIPKEEKGFDLDKKSGEDLTIIKKISNTFKKNMAKGIDEDRISRALIKKGFTENQIQLGLRMSKS